MIPFEMESLLRPLEEFEAIRRRTARLGDRLCDLSYANPYEGVESATRNVLRKALDAERLLDLQYSPFGGQTLVRRAVADDLSARYGLPFAFDDVILTPGAMAALHLALRSVGEPGAEVIIPTPCWLDYPLYARYLGLTPVLVPLSEGSFDIDVQAIADALSERTCAVLLSHPSNPAGRNYDAASLQALADLLNGTDQRITLIADEVQRDFVATGDYRSICQLYDATVLVYSFGKYHFLQGQRTGYLAISPQHPERTRLTAEVVRWTRVMGFHAPTSLMQIAIPELLSLQHDMRHIASWRERMAAELQESGYRVAPADATLFVYVATPHEQEDFAFIRQLAAAGVLALPAPLFHHRGWFRISLTGAERMLERGLAALRRLGAA
jgi:aspartate aminotransferase